MELVSVKIDQEDPTSELEQDVTSSMVEPSPPSSSRRTVKFETHKGTVEYMSISSPSFENLVVKVKKEESYDIEKKFV